MRDHLRHNAPHIVRGDKIASADQGLGFGGAPGTVLWQQSLPAGASARFAAEHVLRYPKELQLREQR